MGALTTSPRRRLLLIPAAGLLVALAAFWVWVGSLRPPLAQDRATYMALFDALHKGKAGEIVPESVRSQARKLGVNPDPGLRSATGDPNTYAAWLTAAQKTAEGSWSAQDRYEHYRDWSLPISIAAVAVALLLFAIAFNKPAEPAPATADEDGAA